MSLSRPYLGVAAVLAGVAISGCGIGEDDDNGPSGDKPRAAPDVTQVVRLSTPKPAKYRKAVGVKPGDVVQLATRVPNAKQAAGSSVRIVAEKGPGRRLVVRSTPAKGKGSGSSATIRGKGGRVSLEELRYVCRVPPETFCPAGSVRETGRGYELVFPVRREGGPIVLLTNVVKGRR